MDFEEAVAFAEKQLAGIETWTEAHKFSRHIADGAEFGNEFDDVEEWIEISAHSRVIFDSVSLRCAQLLRNGVDIPTPLRIWIADVLSGDRQPPPTPKNDRRGSSSLELRDLQIFYVVQRLVNFGLRATRNETAPRLSACDAVAKALAQLRKSPASYDQIKKIYEKNKKGQLFGIRTDMDPDPNVSNFPDDLLGVGEITE